MPCRSFRSRPMQSRWRICAATAPVRGVMSGPLGAMKIGVLDNTGGRMIILQWPRQDGAIRHDWLVPLRLGLMDPASVILPSKGGLQCSC